MTPIALVFIAGASCLLATYDLSRGGDVLLTLVVVAGIGAVSGAAAMMLRRDRKVFPFGSFVLAFVAGSMLSEVASFAHYYATYGYKDPKLLVGVSVSIIEFAVISILGSFSLVVVMWLTKKAR